MVLVGLDLPTYHVHGIPEHRDQVLGGFLQFQAAPADTGEIEQIIHQAQQMAILAMGEFQAASALFGATGPQPQPVQGVLHRPQGIAQFMTQQGHKSVPMVDILGLSGQERLDPALIPAAGQSIVQHPQQGGRSHRTLQHDSSRQMLEQAR